MGDAKRRFDQLGIRKVPLQPGQTIQVEVPPGTPAVRCGCLCPFFIPAVQVFRISALVSPTGQELLAQRPVLVCMKCNQPFGAPETPHPEEVPPQ